MTFLLDLIEYNAEIPYRIVFALLGVGFAFLWLSLVIWVWTDSKAYFKFLVLRFFFSLITLLFGFVGLIIYLLFRSSHFDHIDPLQKVFDSLSFGIINCSRCNTLNRSENYYCTKCGFRLQKRCKGCGNYIRVGDLYCFECGKPLSKESKTPISQKSVERFAQLRYIRGVFKKAFTSLVTFPKVNKGKKKKHNSSK